MFSNTFLKIFFLGWVGRDPEIKNSFDDKLFVTISVAHSYNIRDKDGEYSSKTDWYKVTFYGKQAEFVAHYVTKGSHVFIEGTIRIERFNLDGVEKIAVKIFGNSINLIKNKDKSSFENDPVKDNVEFEESFNDKEPF